MARNFIARHPDAVGLDLGAGLDSRMFRIDPPSTVDWYDVDFPAVATARRQLLPDRANAHPVGADLTDPNWLEAVPTGRPAVIVADGLLAFLTPDDMVALLNRLIDHFPSGEVAFNGYSRFAIWAAKHYHGTQSVAGLLKSPGFDDPHEPERWNPKLQLVNEILLTREPRSPSSHRPCAGSPACPPTAPPGPAAAPRSCTTASSRRRRTEGRWTRAPGTKAGRPSGGA